MSSHRTATPMLSLRLLLLAWLRARCAELDDVHLDDVCTLTDSLIEQQRAERTPQLRLWSPEEEAKV